MKMFLKLVEEGHEINNKMYQCIDLFDESDEEFESDHEEI